MATSKSDSWYAYLCDCALLSQLSVLSKPFMKNSTFTLLLFLFANYQASPLYETRNLELDFSPI